ncbi:MAG: hypothetical protein ACAI25_03905 [Planctomycetota bacterium]
MAAIFTGCPGGKSSSGSGAASPAPTYTDEAAILKADASGGETQAAFAAIALDRSQRATLRLAALRKLEEVQSPRTVATAQALALDPSRAKDATFLRENATGVLFRAKTDEGRAAVAQVQKSSLELAVLVARLERGAK